MKKRLLTFFGALLISYGLQAQDSLSQLLNLPIDKLMEIKIYSASKKEESVFDAPLSAAVVTKEQIKRAGCTSIPEALRLVPGLVVQQQTNGNYDVQVRGVSNVPPNSLLVFFANSTTLVMIDNRPVYNYLHGGTFWETLPVDLNDVERIEVVIGPCAALYGPNAVSGVINIITTRPEREGVYALANAQYGSYNSFIGNASLGYKFNDKVSAWVSGNFQNRDRTQSTYYDVVTNRYVPIDSVTAVKRAKLTDPNIVKESYPDPGLAMRKYAVNGFVNYDPQEKVHFELSIGGQHSEVQKEFGTGLASITTSESDTRYAGLKADIHDFTIQASDNGGTEAPVLGQKIWHWNLNTTDATIEYNLHKIKNLSIRPGISYRIADYNDSRYVNTNIKEGLWNGDARSVTTSASLRLEYLMMHDKLRLIASGRLDKFNYPDKLYTPYQLAATYKINDNNLLRISGGTAYRTPLLIDLFTNLDLTGPFPVTSPTQTYLFQLRGNKDIRLLSTSMVSIGYRHKTDNKMELDIEGYYSMTKHFSDLITGTERIDSAAPVSLTGLIEITNLAVRVQVFGSTISLTYYAGKWQFKPFITVQQSYLLDYSPYANTAQAFPAPSNNNNPAVYNLNSNSGTVVNNTRAPAYFGGAYINYQLNDRLNINVNGYFYAAQTELESDNLTYKDGQRGVQNMNPKLILNAVIGYNLTRKLNIFANFQNCLNDQSVEFYKGDATAFMAFGGFHFAF